MVYPARAYPGFLSMKWVLLGVLLHVLPLDGMPVHFKVTPLLQHFIRLPWQRAGTHSDSWVQRGTVRAKHFPKNPTHWLRQVLNLDLLSQSPVQWSIRLLVSLNDNDEVGNDDRINIRVWILICLIPCMDEDPLHTYQEPWLCQESSSQPQQVPGHCDRKNVWHLIN